MEGKRGRATSRQARRRPDAHRADQSIARYDHAADLRDRAAGLGALVLAWVFWALVTGVVLAAVLCPEGQPSSKAELDAWVAEHPVCVREVAS